MGAVADPPELDPAHPCIDHHLVESLLLRAFKPSPEVLRKPVGKYIIHRIELHPIALGSLPSASSMQASGLEFPSSVTPANALNTLLVRFNIALIYTRLHWPRRRPSELERTCAFTCRRSLPEDFPYWHFFGKEA